MAPLLIQPPSMDFRSYCSPIDDQGDSGSCTGHALAGAINLIDNKKYQKIFRVSRLFIYYQERVIEGTVSSDDGAYLRDGIKACYTYGAPLEGYWPFDLTKITVKPSKQAYDDAVKRKVTSYSRCSNATTIKNSIATGNPVVIGFDVYESFESDAVARTGMMPYPDKRRETYLGGHAVCVVGYRDSDSRLICRNSWGSGWGDRGYFYMPYAVVNDPSMSSDFWSISSMTIQR